MEREANCQRARGALQRVVHVDRRPTRQIVGVVEREVGTRHVTS